MQRVWMGWLVRFSGISTVIGMIMISSVYTLKIQQNQLVNQILNHDPVLFTWFLVGGSLIVLSLFISWTLLIPLFDSSWRWLIQLGWLIQMVGLCALIMFLLAKGFIFPLSKASIHFMSTDHLLSLINQLEDQLYQMQNILIPTSFAIGGLIYTMVMFQVSHFSSKVCWASLLLWSWIILCGVGIRLEWSSPMITMSSLSVLFPLWMWVMGNVYFRCSVKESFVTQH